MTIVSRQGRDAMARRRAAAVAGHHGDTAAARAFLGDDEPAVRSSALRALDRAGGLDAAHLAAALEDPAPAVRVTALELAAGRSDVPVGAAAARLEDHDPAVVEAAAWTCGERLSDGPGVPAPADLAAAVAALTRIAGAHTDPLCRESAIAALGAIAHPDGLPAVLAGR